MKKYGYHEIRRISAYDLRALCIKQNWYTEGTEEEYGKLLIQKAAHKSNINIDDIVEIAEDIKEHSETLYTVEDIMSIVAQATITYIERDPE